MSGQNVGGVRPTQLIYTYGVASAVDLPQFSAMVMGLDDWPAADMEEIREDRLLRVVRHVLGAQVRKLKAAPLREDAPGPLFRNSSGDGVPVAAFPRWLVCTQCRLLAPIRSGLFEFRADTNRPERSGFIHKNCPRLPGRRPFRRVSWWRARTATSTIFPGTNICTAGPLRVPVLWSCVMWARAARPPT